jgi:hypothetical protein
VTAEGAQQFELVAMATMMTLVMSHVPGRTWQSKRPRHSRVKNRVRFQEKQFLKTRSYMYFFTGKILSSKRVQRSLFRYEKQ